ncbi:hypothetical protein HGRIS_002015 [Hohenbuehelia grisea]|uniref:Uncharacterized protein n=1 Tax=Hohenbuehelia grisea TaxID=104357 RepID=A0ABR3JJV3_9AGAR
MSRRPQIPLARLFAGWGAHSARQPPSFLRFSTLQRQVGSTLASAQSLLHRSRRHHITGIHEAGAGPARYSSTAAASTSTEAPPVEYEGPLTATFRRLKIFSLASLTLSFTLSPFIFLIESNLPLIARFALVITALSTSGVSTALVAWCGRPYVATLRRIPPTENNAVEGIEMKTLTLGLHPRITRVYDPLFLIETRRPFAKWELASSVTLPANAVTEYKPGQEEAVAETMDKNGALVGRWIVKWGEDRQGTCHEVGSVVRYVPIFF